MTTTTSATGGRNIFGGSAPEDKLMPNVVCMELQKAQDVIQDHGVFYSKSVDATGEGRRQILDRNWIVVAQTPEPGAKIREGSATLSVVKKGESSPC
jgi:beta-lactam-binding protein with PASTA domain